MISQLDSCLSAHDLTGQGAAAFLECNNASYEALLRLLFDGRFGRAESRLRAVQGLAEFCQFNHPGRFADGALENLALEIGDDLDRTVAKEGLPALSCEMPHFAANGKRHVLHITTSVLEIGGHTRTIRNWISLD